MAQTLLDSFSRLETLCTTGVLLERHRKGKARVGCALAWPCNDHWYATRVAVVGTSNNDSKTQQKVTFDTQRQRTVATCSDAGCSPCNGGATWS